MATTTIGKDLLKLEKRYWQALKDGDVDTALGLTDEPCIVAGPQGVSSIDKKQFESMMKEAKWQIVNFERGISRCANSSTCSCTRVHRARRVHGGRQAADARRR